MNRPKDLIGVPGLVLHWRHSCYLPYFTNLDQNSDRVLTLLRLRLSDRPGEDHLVRLSSHAHVRYMSRLSFPPFIKNN